MRLEEAQAEADRRNREDPDRERFEFYPFDESAGIAPDAWDVAARLRQGPSTERPATAAAAAHPREAVSEGPPMPETAAYQAAEPSDAATEPAYEPAEDEPVYEPEPAAPAEPVHDEPEPVEDWPDDDRPGLFVRLVGLAVIVVGVAWLALVVALALVLSPDNATSFAVYLAAAALGFFAMALGVAIRRS
jgi:hypothetical protein